MKYLKPALYTLFILMAAFKAPTIHYNYIRSHVGNRTFKILRTDGSFSGGTGVQVDLPSGKQGLLTNAHVCGIKDANNMVLVDAEFMERPILRKVIEQADFTDLCLIEAVPGISGIKMGSEPSPGDIVAVVGHPHLLPLTMTRGEVIGSDYVIVIDHIMNPDDPNDKCNLPKNRIFKVDFFGLQIDFCTSYIYSTYTTVTILPGNSGSAVVNSWGHLVGLAYAGDSSSNWGIFIRLADIQKFLSVY